MTDFHTVAAPNGRKATTAQMRAAGPDRSAQQAGQPAPIR